MRNNKNSQEVPFFLASYRNTITSEENEIPIKALPYIANTFWVYPN
jgi:hypothetical protein